MKDKISRKKLLQYLAKEIEFQHNEFLKSQTKEHKIEYEFGGLLLELIYKDIEEGKVDL